jgi:hypothetical protein
VAGRCQPCDCNQRFGLLLGRTAISTNITKSLTWVCQCWPYAGLNLTHNVLNIFHTIPQDTGQKSRSICRNTTYRHNCRMLGKLDIALLVLLLRVGANRAIPMPYTGAAQHMKYRPYVRSSVLLYNHPPQMWIQHQCSLKLHLYPLTWGNT